MNIYLTGAHGVGKTVTSKIITTNTNFSLMPSASRQSPHRHGTLQHQDYVMRQVHKRVTRCDQIISDRTPLDVFAYTKMMEIQPLYDEHEMKVQRFFRYLKHSNETLFYFPILFDLVEDGVRPGREEQKFVNDFIYEYLVESDVDFKTVPMGTPEERANFILKELHYATV